jgi:hypothetical protein
MGLRKVEDQNAFVRHVVDSTPAISNAFHAKLIELMREQLDLIAKEGSESESLGSR